MPKAKLTVKVENVVAVASLKHRIELSAVTNAFPDVEYSPKRFPGLVFRLKKPRSTTLIFGSGKMVCTGTRSEKEARKALRRLIKVLKEGGIIIAGKLDVKITNIVASANLGGAVDLVELYDGERSMRGRIMYEPEQFPGLIYRMNEPKVVILIFASGKLVCTGARKEEDIYRAVSKLHQKLEAKELIRYEKAY